MPRSTGKRRCKDNNGPPRAHSESPKSRVELPPKSAAEQVRWYPWLGNVTRRRLGVLLAIYWVNIPFAVETVNEVCRSMSPSGPPGEASKDPPTAASAIPWADESSTEGDVDTDAYESSDSDGDFGLVENDG